MYDSALWASYNIGSMNKLRSCYHKCVKMFFGFKRSDSMTNILLQLRLPSFNTLLANGAFSFRRQMLACNNVVVKQVLLCIVDVR
jgi:hypothetical protein